MGAQSGIEVTTVLINPHKYLRYLLDKFEANGGVFEVREVSHIDEVSSLYSSFVFLTLSLTFVADLQL